MKLGFIGAGKMATALLTGIVKTKTVAASDITVSDLNSDALSTIKEKLGVNVTQNSAQVVSQSEIIVLAVKPNVVLSILNSVKSQIKDQLIISIAAGLDLTHLQSSVNPDTSIVRVMPNLNATVGEAAIAICHNNRVNEEQLATAHRLLESSGELFDLPEDKFGLFTAISGSSPAFTFLYIDSLARAGVKYGLPKKLADKIAAQAVFGSAKLMQETGKNPWDLIDDVSSPGGTTVAGLLEMQANNFQTAVIKGVDATIAQDTKLNK
ncbi:pyrroline-5-carboxylate reductase [Xylocopilactobacillus apicola]|uniref:Pyrroline-5-carboxylate reductase n=1 Tax=Xylocopilactobacillus apicola TaxID=2932184 RepID=A0AAU9D6L4_9LACO|nr:pyrroline-5-carboxylate reductase [Xylocopilactobacillus apicola]BDR58001.1 pyrroline-5-carboxylate reductase [Xylocopilactobacillus apicola]